MVTLERLGARDLAAVMVAFRDALRSHQEVVNRLNVYPVPDGDTGTNMALTMESVVAEIDARKAETLADVASAVAYGSLMGARGNSGVILSQILRGLSEAAATAEELGPGELAEGLRRAAEGAYAAVNKPVEGTILTVVRSASEAASRVEGSTGAPTLMEMVEAASASARTTLAATPEMLPVLKSAGVVDSGGTGLLLMFDALAHVAGGRPLPEPPPSVAAGAATGPVGIGRHGVADGGAQPHPGGPRFEVMYLLEAPDESVPAFREVWAGVGDSIVVVGGSGLYNCHIHTDDIGAAVEAALEAGRPRQIRVTDLFEEVEEESWVRMAAGEATGAEDPEEHVRCGVVAVAAGDGIRRIFRSLGVHHVVGGGQSMNPSTAEVVAALEATRADEVVILPNNKNVVPVAEAAAAAFPKPVKVVPTRGIQEGFAALLEYDPESGSSSNAELMARSAGRVVAGEVTSAVRDAATEAGPVVEGDWIGVSRQRIEVVAKDLASAATGLLDRLVDAAHHEIVTIIAGEGSGAADTRRITEWVSSRHPEMSVELHHGGQPLYPYLFSVE